ncbi:hypothetical protein [Thiobacillus sp. 65-1402]|uniref:hypothetical protein n=1 Tax=Thiobacillus sp. 65-1402 TaxID=1895861 RepID=UPI00095B49D3|nr:hypothetical protein [Thiobacillus sp. 65-1402]OJW76549.1 MAG: hypothetical protein BGO62_01580 [Thiobacillus sp. 65-1402]
MRIRTLLATLAFVATGFALQAVADSIPAPAVQAEALSPEACLARAKGDRVAQLSCCKAHKGVCGCRAGKIVCCDNTTSTEPGCTCHRDEGVTE